MKRFLSAVLTLILALSLAVPALAANPGDTFIRVLGSSGTRTVGVRTTYGELKQVNGALVYDDRYEFVYTDDGVTWVSAGAAETNFGSGMYDGTQFLAGPFRSDRPTWRSADGIHWTPLTAEEQAAAPTIQRGRSSVNGLTFTLRGAKELWVTDGQGRSAELNREFSDFLGSYDMADVQAWPVPGGIRVAVYSRYTYAVCAAYTYSPTVLEAKLVASAGPGALQPDFRYVTGNGEILLGQARLGADETENLYSADGLTWQEAEGMPAGTLLPYNGKTFVVVSGEPAGVYASEDGLTWRSLDDTVFQPEREEVLADYTFLWTGTEYISCRTVEEPYGPHGVRGDWVSQWNTKVCFADAYFRLTGSYDFGVNVTDVGYVRGTYYAKAGGTVWSSYDGTEWTATILAQIPKAEQNGTYRIYVNGDQVYGHRRRGSGSPLFTASWPDLNATLWEGWSVYAVVLTDEDDNVRDIRVFTGEQMEALLPKELSVLVDGKPVAFPILLYQVSGCTMAPLRQLAGAFGYTFSYDGSTGTAVCTKGDATISVREGSTMATVNGVSTDWLAVPAQLHGGIFCVPVRFFAEAAGADTAWDGDSLTFTLTTT